MSLMNEDLVEQLSKKALSDYDEIRRLIFKEGESGLDYPSNLTLENLKMRLKKVSVYLHSSMFLVPCYEVVLEMLNENEDILGNIEIVYSKELDYLDHFTMFKGYCGD